jgi:lysozyme
LTPKESVDLMIAWMEGVKSRLGGVQPIVYLSPSFADTVCANDARLKNYPLWLAHYTSASAPRVPRPWDYWTFWQYTETGRVPGISTNCDINRFNGAADRLNALTVK